MGLENPIHIAIILVVVLLVFGAKRLPEMGRSMGEGMRGFKDSLQGQPEQPSQPQPASQLTAAAAPVAQPTQPAPAPALHAVAHGEAAPPAA